MLYDYRDATLELWAAFRSLIRKLHEHQFCYKYFRQGSTVCHYVLNIAACIEVAGLGMRLNALQYWFSTSDQISWRQMVRISEKKVTVAIGIVSHNHTPLRKIVLILFTARELR